MKILLFIGIAACVFCIGSVVAILLKRAYELVAALVFVICAASNNPVDFSLHDPESLAEKMTPEVLKSVEEDALYQAFDWASRPAEMAIRIVYVFFYLLFHVEVRRRFYRRKRFKIGQKKAPQDAMAA